MKKTSLTAALVLAAGLLQAATVTYTNSAVMNNDVNTVINLTKFDSSLGTLTAVYVQYVVSIAGANVQMDNDSALAQNGTARVQNLVNSFSSGASTLSTDYTTLSKGDFQINASQVFRLSGTSGDTVGQFNITGNSDYANWTPGTLQAIGASDINSLVFSQYTGSGTYAVSINPTFTTTATFDGSDGYFQGNTPSGLFAGAVTYTYSPIPEPATASMSALVILAAAWIRRRFID
ncbi:MAG TPA: choice-of-anchor E domain-containing protein [Pontiellaceae bacterium]|nr:choice-of-anchor E domain-containing protein [Pontiellaceae bacterium]